MSSSTIHLRHPESPPSSLEPVRVRNTYILFFISGNPGLIQYYCTFLCHLYALLSCNVSGQASAGEDRFQVVGRDLLGFEVDGANRIGASPPHGLQAQIEATEKALESLVDEETGSPQVILIGHSVGAYILLEVLRRHREKARVEAARGGLRIFGGICLFPTVTHIAESQSGKQFGSLLCRPHFAHVASLVAKLLLALLPSALLHLLIRSVMRFPADAAATTTAFLKSRWGIRQALHMARDEMLSITTDAWDEEVWGASHRSTSSYPRAQLRFLFGQEDHWVSDATRDDLIRARASKADSEDEHWKPKMEVDEEGWPHAFCIRHSVPVAEKVAGYVRDIIDSRDPSAFARE